MCCPIKGYTDNCIQCKLCIRACNTSLSLQGEIDFAEGRGWNFYAHFPFSVVGSAKVSDSQSQYMCIYQLLYWNLYEIRVIVTFVYHALAILWFNQWFR